jgi:predicted amidophosphoribosyltransferase
MRYKHGNPENHTALAALMTRYSNAHDQDIQKLLGGPASQIAVVPSTRGRSFASHPLASAVARSLPLHERLVDVLTHVEGATITRQEYKPSIFRVDSPSVRGERLVLVEDLWVSGSKAVSAAGALLEAGAQSVVILPVAREIRPSSPFCGEDHPYVEAMRAPYVIESWPR